MKEVTIMNSILTSTKQLSGVTKEYEHFDDELIAYINSVFFTLRQLGVGPAGGFVITDATATWDEVVPDDPVLREALKSYMKAKVKLQFDPPTGSALLDSLNEIITEFEWRLNVEVETPTK